MKVTITVDLKDGLLITEEGIKFYEDTLAAAMKATSYNEGVRDTEARLRDGNASAFTFRQIDS